MWTPDGLEKRYDGEMRGLEDYGVIDAGRTITVAGSPDQFPASEDHVVEALREQWNDAANTLAVKPLAIPGSELVRARRGARCMSIPLLRAGV